MYKHIRNTKEPWALMVEDDADLRMSAMLLIQDRGCKVIGASNGLDAIKVMVGALHKDHMPSVILLDLNMPVFNGWEFLDLLEVAQPKIKSIPVVITSGERMPELSSRYKFLKKPYSEEDLIKELTEPLKECLGGPKRP